MTEKISARAKVENLTPSSKEKSTLIAIASFSWEDPYGAGCYAKVESIAKKCGHSVRTVQNHIATMTRRCLLPRIGNEDNGSDQANAELRVEYQAKPYIRTNKYFINVCRQEGISTKQMKLALKTEVPMSEEKIGAPRIVTKSMQKKSEQEIDTDREQEPIADNVQEIIDRALDKMLVSIALEKPKDNMFRIGK